MSKIRYHFGKEWFKNWSFQKYFINKNCFLKWYTLIKKNQADSEKILHWKLTLKVRIYQLLTTFTQLTARLKKLFNGQVDGFEPKGKHPYSNIYHCKSIGNHWTNKNSIKVQCWSNYRGTHYIKYIPKKWNTQLSARVLTF